MEALKLTCLHIAKDINMLAVYILTVEINGSVETSGLIHLPKCWCLWMNLRNLRCAWHFKT